MAKPVKHGDKWRIRWLDERGERQSAHDDYKVAQTELRRRQVEVEEVRLGLRNAPPPEKTGGDWFAYWLEKRAIRKRSQKDDESIIHKHLRPRFGATPLRDIGVEDGDEYLCYLFGFRRRRDFTNQLPAHKLAKAGAVNGQQWTRLRSAW